MEKTVELLFQYTSLDYRVDYLRPYNAKYWKDTLGDDYAGKVPEIRMFGRDKNGKTFCVHIHGFLPFFYVQLPEKVLNSEENMMTLSNQIQEKISREYIKYNSTNNKTMYIYDLEQTVNTPIRGYHKTPYSNFCKVTLVLPPSVPCVRSLFEQKKVVTYESDVPFVLRYITDRRARPCGWNSVRDFSFREKRYNVTMCDYEVDVHYSTVIHYSKDSEQEKWSHNAPFKILSFDIECESDGSFPDAEVNKVIQIGNYVTEFGGSDKPSKAVIHCLGDTDDVNDGLAETKSYKTERMLLKDWAEFVRKVDPDFITGYNIDNFDLPYVIKRAKKLGIQRDFTLGRVKGEFPSCYKKLFTSKARGTIERWETKITGRTAFDVYQIVKREFKLKSYTLNYVAWNFLKQKKEDVPHSIITPLWKRDSQARRKLAIYCLKDALLPLRIISKKLLLLNEVEMSRVCWVPIDMMLSRGQTVKVKTQLMIAGSYGPNGDGVAPYLIPVKPRIIGGNSNDMNSSDVLSREVSYKGATVLPPKRGYYSGRQPISTLDFASLYPSIMQAHNLCYTTSITEGQARKMKAGVDYTKTPSGHYFVLPTLRKGLLPQVLTNLLGARKIAKKKMNEAYEGGNKPLGDVYNAKQGALKICANSVYGFTGAEIGPLPDLTISASVTSFGRQMIDITKQVVEDMYREEYPDVEVIYGDTDSVMVSFGKDISIETAIELAKHAQIEVNKKFKPPIRIEFEKVMCPLLLITKKKYIYLFWDKPDKSSGIKYMGVEVKRRDSSPLLRNTQSSVCEIIFDEKKIDNIEENDHKRWQEAIQYVQSVVGKLYTGQYNMSDLIITKGYTKPEEQYKGKQIHIELAKRMAKRDPGTAPHVGDRIPFVITKRGKGAKRHEETEDPLYALKNDVPISVEYYIEKQLETPLTRIFLPYFLSSPEYKIEGSTLEIREKEAEKLVKKTLFGADVSRKRVTRISETYGIGKFFKVQTKCLECNAISKEPVCKNCIGKLEQTKKRIRIEYEEADGYKKKCWQTCYDCQLGDIESAHSCLARDCDDFFPRHKADIEYTRAEKKYKRF